MAVAGGPETCTAVTGTGCRHYPRKVAKGKGIGYTAVTGTGCRHYPRKVAKSASETLEASAEMGHCNTCGRHAVVEKFAQNNKDLSVKSCR